MITHQLTTKQDIDDFKTYVEDNKYTVATSISFKSTGCLIQFEDHEQFNIEVHSLTFTEKNDLMKWLQPFKNKPVVPVELPPEALIFGKDTTQNIVSVEVNDGTIEIFTEKEGKISVETRPHTFWLLSARQFNSDWKPLAGNLHYKYIKHYATKREFYLDKNKYREADVYGITNEKESTMLTTGITYYKGMKVNDVSRFHFDLETVGLEQNDKSFIYLISTTFVKQGVNTKKLFSIDEYDGPGEMLVDFCKYVRECDPSIVTGFNIFGYDLPYLRHCAELLNVDLSLGRNGSNLSFEKYTSKFRKDGSQSYDYHRAHIYGRELIDVMHTAYHFDFARKYESYGLKKIIAQEGLEKPGRQHYDASQISKNWHIPEERVKIKQYCIDDSDDNESLFTLMIPAYFYLTPSIPKSFQTINYSATGSQINAFMVRAYLQEGHSIPKADEVISFEGGISDGFPGIYTNVFKVDVASLYPSIMLQYEVYDAKKDPKAYLLKSVKHFTEQRLFNKKMGKETGERRYKEMEQGQKIFINSASFGFLGAAGLNFNSPTKAAFITETGRSILKKAALWATSREYIEKKQDDELGNIQD
jgi:DNA polymerase elongation subunit (family B)